MAPVLSKVLSLAGVGAGKGWSEVVIVLGVMRFDYGVENNCARGCALVRPLTWEGTMVLVI